MSQFSDARATTLQSAWVAARDPALCEMMRPENTHWECWYARRPAIYDDDGELVVAEIAPTSACYATGLIPQRPAAPVMLCTSENYQCMSPNFIGCCLCEDLMDTMAKGYNATRHWMWHCPVMLVTAWRSSCKFFRGLLANLAQGPWLTELYALLCEGEADGTHGRSRCGCYPPLRFRSLTFISPSHVAMWWNQRRGKGWFDTTRSPAARAIGIPARLAPNKVD